MLFYYEVEVFEDDKMYNYGGFFCANSFGEAAQQLELFWGDTLNAVLKLAPYDTSFFAVPLNVAREIEKKVSENV